jgi:TolA-binding protein
MLGTIPAGSAPLSGAPAAAVKRTPELALQEGNAALARRDYATAEASAREVIANNKTTPRGYDAQFLLAQAMTGQKNYPQAAVAYGDTYDRAKQGQHAQDSLVGLAGSLAAINEKRSACAALDTLKAQFPTPRADIATRAAALRTASACR